MDDESLDGEVALKMPDEMDLRKHEDKKATKFMM